MDPDDLAQALSPYIGSRKVMSVTGIDPDTGQPKAKTAPGMELRIVLVDVDGTPNEMRAVMSEDGVIYPTSLPKPASQGSSAPILRDTSTGLKRYNPETGALEPVPGGEKGDPIDTAWKNNLDRTEQIQRIRQGEREAADYMSPQEKADLQIRTAAASRKSSAETMAEDANRADLARETDRQKALLEMDKINRQYELKRQELIEQMYRGLEIDKANAILDQWKAANVTEYNAWSKRLQDIEEYNRKLPELQAQEDRAASAEGRAQESAFREGQRDKAGGIKDQMSRAQELILTLTGSGVNADVFVEQQFNAQNRLMQLLNQQYQPTGAATPRKLEPMAPPPAPTPRPMPDLSQYMPPSSMGDQRLPPAAPPLEEEDPRLMTAGRR